MATSFVVTASRNPQIFKDVGFKDGAIKYSIDFTPWQDDNATVTGVTWTVISGSATVSGEALTSGVATALVTFGSEGGTLIQIKATTASSGIYVLYLEVLAKDPNSATDDNGFYV